MADLVIDEWLWSDLEGENGVKKQDAALEFLLAVFNKCDRLVIVKGSPFMEKTFNFFKHTEHTDLRRREIIRFYKSFFLYNSNKSAMLEDTGLESIAEQISTKVKQDDVYLVQAYRASNASVIVTTDHPLMEALPKQGITCKHRDEFVQDYILKYGGKQGKGDSAG